MGFQKKRSELAVPYKRGTDKIPVRQTTTTARGWRTPWYVVRVASLPLLLNTEPMFIEGSGPQFDATPVREVTAAERVNPNPTETAPVREVTSATRRR